MKKKRTGIKFMAAACVWNLLLVVVPLRLASAEGGGCSFRAAL